MGISPAAVHIVTEDGSVSRSEGEEVAGPIRALFLYSPASARGRRGYCDPGASWPLASLVSRGCSCGGAGDGDADAIIYIVCHSNGHGNMYCPLAPQVLSQLVSAT